MKGLQCTLSCFTAVSILTEPPRLSLPAQHSGPARVQGIIDVGFDFDHLSRISQRHAPTVSCSFSFHVFVYRMLIGACNLIVCPISRLQGRHDAHRAHRATQDRSPVPDEAAGAHGADRGYGNFDMILGPFHPHVFISTIPHVGCDVVPMLIGCRVTLAIPMLCPIHPM